jgi:hypothetical protein
MFRIEHEHTNPMDMKHISILVPKGAILGSLEGSRQLLTQVNSFLASKGAPPVFSVHLVGLTHETKLCGGAYRECSISTTGC